MVSVISSFLPYYFVNQYTDKANVDWGCFDILHDVSVDTIYITDTTIHLTINNSYLKSEIIERQLLRVSYWIR